VELLGDYVEPLRPVDLKADGFAEYLVSFDLPPEARPATYAGAIVFRTGQTPVASLPLKVQVLPLAAPDMKGYLVGGIYNIGMGLERNEAFYRTYAKLHFNYLMLFDYLFGSTKGGEVDFDAAGKQVEQIVRLGGVTGGIGLYREPNMSEDQPRKWYQIASGRPDFAGPYKTGTDARFKEGYQKLAGQADQYARRHDWPTLVYMVSDEPSDSRDLDASMGWLKEAIPDAVTIADAQFADMVKTRQWYNLPVLDDPVDWTGPLVYQFVKAKAGRFGICGTGWPLEVGRYQPGLMLASSGACYWHFWHLKGPMEPKDGQVLRSHTLAAAAEGFNDLRYFVALKEAIARAKGTTQPAVAVEAEKYLASIFAFASADHDRHLYPYNGVPADWGCHRFYDNWRTRMKDFILALKK
jgi:hypothetical protein